MTKEEIYHDFCKKVQSGEYKISQVTRGNSPILGKQEFNFTLKEATMGRVYTLWIKNYDALDFFMTTFDVKVFADKSACEKWMDQEIKRQASQGFKLAANTGEAERWEFVKNDDYGVYRHELYGQYRNIIGGTNND